MKWRFLLSVVLLLQFFRMSSHSCVDMMDQFSFGVLFNNNEELILDRFDSLGKEGIHFLRDNMMIKPDPLTKEVKILTPTRDPVNWNDMFSINNIVLTSHFLKIDVNYGGGCKTHEFILYVDSILTDGDPPILNFTLLHNANDDACKALVSETLVFDIQAVTQLHPGMSPLQMKLNNKMTGIKWYPDNTCIIKYRSHYIPELMVYLEHSSMGSSQSPVFPGMRIIMDPAVKYVIGVDYGQAVLTELQWLKGNKVLNRISDTTLIRIGKKTGTDRGQFWTYQDSLIPYGAFFTLNKSSDGEWVWSNVAQVVNKRCGSTLDFTLPPEQLNSPSTTVKSGSTSPVHYIFSVALINNAITINLNSSNVPSAEISIMDLKGRILNKVKVPAYQNRIVIKTAAKLPCGIYQILLTTKERSIRKELIVTK